MKKIVKIIIIVPSLLGVFLLLLYIIPMINPKVSTTYSKNFSYLNFDKIRIGEKRLTVDSLLGIPLYISKDNVNKDSIKINYWYTKENSLLMEYDKIIIQFYNGKVVKKIRVLDGD